jgi:hypothetical protein
VILADEITDCLWNGYDFAYILLESWLVWTFVLHSDDR